MFLLQTIAKRYTIPICPSNKSFSSVLFRNCNLQLHHVRLTTSNATNVKNDSVTSKVLRAYQQECVDASLEQLRFGKRRQIVSLPVGMQASKPVI
jgi:superfamily II DNA or RNA helicase